MNDNNINNETKHESEKELIDQEPIITQVIEEPINAELIQESINNELIQETVDVNPIQETVNIQPVQEPINNNSIQESINIKPVQEPINIQPVQEPIINQQINSKPHIKKEKKRHPVLYAFLIAIISFSTAFFGGFAGELLSKLVFEETINVKTNINYEPVEHLTDKGLSVQQIAEYNMQTVVEIMTETSVTSFFQQDYIATGAGSGVIISDDGYIVTNNHVIEGANNIIVKLSDGEEHSAKLIGTDTRLDVAVIKIEKDNLQSAIFGDSEKLKIGDEVIAIGNPLGEFGGSVTDGIISGKNREITVENQNMTLLQTNAQINKGNSGGGLFDGNGNLIGIVVAKSAGDSVEGLGFAIPINDAKDVIQQIIDHGYVTNRPTLGVSISEVPYGGTQKAGVYIADIVEGSPAEKAGLLINDRIISIDKTEVTVLADLSNYIQDKKVGDTVLISVVRNNEIVSHEVILGDSSINH